MRKYFFCGGLLFFFVTTSVFSQTLRQPVSAVYLGLGAYSTKHGDVFSYVNNQAALAQVKKSGVGVYGEKRFMLKETGMYAASVAVPTKMGNFGVNMKYFGYSNYNENQVGLAYARSLGPKFDLGIQFNYYGYKVASYGSESTVDFEIGAIVHLTDKINAGVHVYNPVGGEFSKTGEELASAVKFGFGYDATENFFLSAEIVKEENYPVNVNMGIQYQFAKQFFARAGFASATSTGYAGVGVGWSNLRLDITTSYHQQLGFSPGLLLIMNFGDKKSEK